MVCDCTLFKERDPFKPELIARQSHKKRDTHAILLSINTKNHRKTSKNAIIGHGPFQKKPIS